MLGLGYVAYVEYPSVAEWLEPRARRGGIVHGLIWGVVTTILFSIIVMPLWLQAVGFGGTPPFPNIAFSATLMGLIEHFIYAVPVGVLYTISRD